MVYPIEKDDFMELCMETVPDPNDSNIREITILLFDLIYNAYQQGLADGLLAKKKKVRK